jgi:hypothetical protein
VRRPDFLDGLGVYVGARDVAIAGVSKRLLQVRLREARSVPLPPRDQADARRRRSRRRARLRRDARI